MVNGDINAHFAYVCEVNARNEKLFDRALLALFEGRTSFNCRLLNLKGIPTQESGSVVDTIACTPDCNTKMTIIPVGKTPIKSDHALLLAVLPGGLKLQPQQQVGYSTWRQDGDWNRALSCVASAVLFITGWASSVMRSSMVRNWVADGRRKGTRQMLSDKAVWWCAIVITTPGHFSGLAVVTPPKRPMHLRISIQTLLRRTASDGETMMGSSTR